MGEHQNTQWLQEGNHFSLSKNIIPLTEAQHRSNEENIFLSIKN